MPPQFTEPIESQADGQGMDVVAQSAAIMHRSNDAVATTTQAYYLRPHSGQDGPPAAGAEPAIGIITITRSAPAIGPITIPAGTIVVATIRHPDGTTSDGERFQTRNPLTIPSGDTQAYSIDIVAMRVGYQGNLDAGQIDHFYLRGRANVPNAFAYTTNTIDDSGVPDQFTQSMIGQYLRFLNGPNVNAVPRQILSFSGNSVVVDGPALVSGIGDVEVEEWADLGLSIDQPINTFNGRHGWLDAVGQDRNVSRVSGESDEAFRSRIVNLADTISPAAIRRICARILTPFGIPFELLEAGTDGLGLILDDGPYDDEALTSWYVPGTRFFVISVGNGNLGEFGFAFDATDQINAYDVTGNTPPVVNFYDGSPVVYLQAIQSLWQALNDARAAGVGFAIVRDVT